MTTNAEIWSYGKILAIRVSLGACMYTRVILALLGKKCSLLQKKCIVIGLLPLWIRKREMYLWILIPILDRKWLRQGLEAALDPLWDLDGRWVHKLVTLTNWNSKYAWAKTPGWDVYELGGKLSSSPSCWDLQCWDPCHMDFNHAVSHHDKMRLCEDEISAVAREKCGVWKQAVRFWFLLVREEQRLPPEWEGWLGPHMNFVLGCLRVAALIKSEPER